jgi:diguanylate cyclase (GGDEF)-like protein
VSLIDADRQWFKSSQGLLATQTERTVSFCGHAILDDTTLVVTDASQDPRFADNPLVVGEPLIRFYAGCPIRSPDGYRVGTLCAFDQVPREPTWEDLMVLKDLAALVEVELRTEALGESERELREQLTEVERRASIDSLTRLWNRETTLRLLREEVERAGRLKLHLAILLIDVDHFKTINDTHGHPAGDVVLREVAMRLRSAVRNYDSVGRYGGEEFIAILPGCDTTQASVVATRVLQQLHAGSVVVAGSKIFVTVSIGVFARQVDGTETLDQFIEGADQALYAAKRAGRDQVMVYDR